MFSFNSTAKTALGGAAIAAALALPLVGSSAAFAGDATFPPVAVADYYSTAMDTQLLVNAANGLLVNDLDGGNAGLVAHTMTLSADGALDFTSDGAFQFTPVAGFVGIAHFTYDDEVGGFLSNHADVYIEVTAPAGPSALANPDVYETFVNSALVVDAASGVLANDVSALNVHFQDELEGEIAMSTDGSFTYTPALDFVGTKTFNYNVSDAGNANLVSNWASVTITVKPVSIIPSIPVPANPGGGNPGSTTGGDLPTLAFTGAGDVAVWLIAPALALLGLGAAGVWFTRRRRALGN
jgi:hypothetical protein